MANEFSYPWSGTTLGDAGPYSAEDWWGAWQRLSRGLRANASVIGGTNPTAGSQALRVTANSPAAANVLVSAGAALVDGTLYKNDATQTLSIAANASGNPRIDLIVLRRDDSLQTVRLAVKQGTPAVSPSVPSLTQTAGVMWEIALARVAVANGFTSIAQSDITPVAEPAGDAANVYLYDVLNNSGGELVTGDVVVVDTSADRAAKTTTTRNDSTVLGVWAGATANGGYGRVLVDGIGYIRVNAAISTRGNLLITSPTAKAAQAYTLLSEYGAHQIGVNLETVSGAGLVLARIRPRFASEDINPMMWGRMISYGATFSQTGLILATTAGSLAAQNDTDGPYTQWRTGATGGLTSGLGDTDYTHTRRRYNPKFYAMVRAGVADPLTNVRYWIGFTTADFTNSDTMPGSGAAFRFSTVAGDAGWVPVVRDGVTQQVGTSLGAFNTTDAALLGIRFDDAAGMVYFSLNRGTEQAMSANIPAQDTNMGLAVMVITTNAANKSLRIRELQFVPLITL